MRNWLLRGLVLAAAMLVVRVVQGALINTFPTWSGLISVALVLLFAIGAVVWGLRDGRADAMANPDPDRRADLAMVWLVAGLVAGALSGVVAWLLGLFDKALYTGGILNELTTFAAFTALLVFLAALAGVAIGRWRVDRQLAKAPVRHHGLAAGEDRADTDVFAAVSVGGAEAGEDATAAASAVTSGGAHYRDAGPVQEFPTEAAGGIAPDEETTGVIRPEDRPQP
ncbi:B-4DMT family transporter [Mycobacterium sp. pUA109]|uniref:B-4DMT family transporter n=1 Tax=Mycobacterium sp. pUA109 TaxID=3238982 RepID=UPI00351AD701